MLNVNYGTDVSEGTKSQIAKLLAAEGVMFNTGISEDLIMEMMNHSGEKVINITSGKTIENASKWLPDNHDERISEAAVLIKVNSHYQFFAVELANLIRYFDSYPLDPQITWRYALDSNQEDAVTIIILKILTNNETH